MHEVLLVKEKLKDYDYTLIFTPLLLAGFGIVMIYSASMVAAVVEGLDSTYYLFRQLQWFVIAFIGFLFCCIFPYRHYQKLTKAIVLISVIALICVLFFGDTVNKATRSIDIIGVNIQPSEFVKLALIIYSASVYSKKQTYIENFFQGVFPPLLLTFVMVGLIVIQPDIGTATIILLIVSTIIISSGIRFKHLLLLITFSTTILLLILDRKSVV